MRAFCNQISASNGEGGISARGVMFAYCFSKKLRQHSVHATVRKSNTSNSGCVFEILSTIVFASVYPNDNMETPHKMTLPFLQCHPTPAA